MMIAPAHILVPVDFSVTAEVALRYGRELASTFGATLHVLHAVGDAVTLGAVPPTYGAGAELGSVVLELETDARQRLRDLVAKEPIAGVKTVEVVLTATSPSSAIVNYAKEHAIDLVIMGTHGRGAVAHFLLGSVTESVVRSAPCPVLTVRQSEREWRVVDRRTGGLTKARTVRPVKAAARKRTVA